MTTLSSAAWIAHDVGLATAIGGTIFGQAALEPGMKAISNPEERDLVSDEAWRRFSWINLAAHGLFATTWFVGRGMLSGREVSGPARKLTLVKDVLVVSSLVTGVASIIAGRMLGKKSRDGMGPEAERSRATGNQKIESRRVEKAVGGLGLLNLIANVGIAAVTVVLSMQGQKSMRFAARSRRLP